MDIVIGLIIGLVVGAIVAYVIGTRVIKKSNQKAIEESNRQADLTIQEARLSAKRITDEAALQVEKFKAKSEADNERIKQQKIQEAKERYSQMRSQFDSEKAQHQVKLKEMEIDIVAKQKDLQAQQDAFQHQLKDIETRKTELDNRETEMGALRENLDKQLKIVQRKREELDQANEERIKALEQIAQLTQQDAKDQLLEAVRAKSESESMAIVKEAVAHLCGCYLDLKSLALTNYNPAKLRSEVTHCPLGKWGPEDFETTNTYREMDGLKPLDFPGQYEQTKH